MKRLVHIAAAVLLHLAVEAQPVPAVEENIPFLVTFGAASEKSWGDDDFLQIFFFVVPKGTVDPVHIRVFDADLGGELDEAKGAFDGRTRFSVYGGKGAISDPAARGTEAEGNYRSGNLLAMRDFAVDTKYDQEWYTFGPFDPNAGELMPEYGGLVFKVICQGLSGDDGNLYRYFMSRKATSNDPIDGGQAFTFEYTFRMHDDPNEVSHIFPFIDEQVVSVKQSNFDWDGDGFVRIVSVAKKGDLVKASGENEWVHSEHKITEAEHNTSLDIRFIKRQDVAVKNNNVVFLVRNQYGELLPFHTVPIGGIPQYKPSIVVRKQ